MYKFSATDKNGAAGVNEEVTPQRNSLGQGKLRVTTMEGEGRTVLGVRRLEAAATALIAAVHRKHDVADD